MSQIASNIQPKVLIVPYVNGVCTRWDQRDLAAVCHTTWLMGYHSRYLLRCKPDV